MRGLLVALVLLCGSVVEAGYPYYGYGQQCPQSYYGYYGPQPYSYRSSWATWPGGGYQSVHGIAPSPMGPQPYSWWSYWW